MPEEDYAENARESKGLAHVKNVGGIAGDRLRSFIERIERLEEEKRATASDIKEVFAEAKGSGFDPAIIRLLIKERRMDRDDLDEQEALLQAYRQALGMLADTDLGRSALRRAEVTKRALGFSHIMAGLGAEP